LDRLLYVEDHTIWLIVLRVRFSKGSSNNYEGGLNNMVVHDFSPAAVFLPARKGPGMAA